MKNLVVRLTKGVPKHERQNGVWTQPKEHRRGAFIQPEGPFLGNDFYKGVSNTIVVKSFAVQVRWLVVYARGKNVERYHEDCDSNTRNEACKESVPQGGHRETLQEYRSKKMKIRC